MTDRSSYRFGGWMDDERASDRSPLARAAGETGPVGEIGRLVARGHKLGGFGATTTSYDESEPRSCVVCLGVPSIGDPVVRDGADAIAHPSCLDQALESLEAEIRMLAERLAPRE